MDYPRIVYALRHNPTGKIYIGSTRHPQKRLMTHFYTLKNGNHQVKAMQEDFDKYGDDYSVFILDVITRWYDRQKEYYWMDVFHTRDPVLGYNTNDKALAPKITDFKEFKLFGNPNDTTTFSLAADQILCHLPRV